MRTGRCHIHSMATNCLVLQTVMKQVENLVDAFALYIQKVLHSVDIVLIPFELESVLTSIHIEEHFALLARLEHVAVKQVIYFFVV